MKRVDAFRPFDEQLRSAIAQKCLLQLSYKGKQRLVGGRGDSSQQHMEWDELFARVEPAKS